MGVGTPSGAEVVVHACRNFISKAKSENILLKIDFKNAFNSERRDRLLHKVHKLFPQIYMYTRHILLLLTCFFGFETLSLKKKKSPTRRSARAVLVRAIN